jgi:hypothetical protein
MFAALQDLVTERVDDGTERLGISFSAITAQAPDTPDDGAAIGLNFLPTTAARRRDDGH